MKRTAFFLLATLAILLPIFFYAATQQTRERSKAQEDPLLAGLVVYLPMDESSWVNDCSTGTVLDVSGNNNHATSCPNLVGPTGGALGKYGNAGSFNGSLDFLRINDSPSLHIGTNVTISLWVKKLSESDYGAYVAKNLSGWYQLLNHQNNGRLAARTGEDGDTLVSNKAIELNEWRFLTVTYDGTTAKIYIDGTLDAQSAVAQIITNDETPLTIGRRPDGSVPNNVVIDEFRIYNRTLSDAEVFSLYQSSPPSPTLVPTNTPAPTPPSRSDTAPPLTQRVFALSFDPIIASQGQKRLSAIRGTDSAAPSVRNNQFIGMFRQFSHNHVRFSVEELVVDDFPPKVNGFTHTFETFMECENNPQSHPYCQADADIDQIIATYDVCGKVNRDEIDELWIFAPSQAGFFESALLGPRGFNYNGRTYSNNSCQKTIPMMGLRYDAGPGNGVHNFGHRAEATMTKAYGRWQGNNPNPNTWEKFGMTHFESPSFPYAGCGSIHYTPNARGTQDTYIYNIQEPFDSVCDDFANYPALGDPLQTKRPVGCSTWDCTELGYYGWWFSHIPYFTGTNDGKLNDWWHYVLRPEFLLSPITPTPTPTVTPTITPTPTPRPTVTPTPTPTPTPQACKPGDINRDGVVNEIDYGFIIVNYFRQFDRITNPRADINGDGIVDISDYSLLVKDYGTATGTCL